ncbi:hypothetical protein DLR69_16590 [Vibrio paracholerae]|uniref:Uncharacterized protein n=1 Tax=Vibrio paracholerae TaxID=650003 RepID=A0AAX1QXS3_9VIBR|nr:hypothetical protein DLR69_16590 [Vibrio paracholerae]RBM83761.1 hypothetical protein DLR70_05010 [Vibrio paracholerae]
MFIPFLPEAAAVLATLIHPNNIVCLCSWGFTYLPPTCNSKLLGIIATRREPLNLLWIVLFQ